MLFSSITKTIGKRLTPNFILFRISPILVSVYSRILTWYLFNRHYAAPIKPMELYKIDPHLVKTRISSHNFSYPLPVSEVAGGNWDINSKSLSEYDLYQGLIDHFKNDVCWEDTDFFQRRKINIKNGEHLWGCTTPEELHDHLNELDALFESIVKNGYCSQRYLQTIDQNPRFRDIHRFWPPELHEVTVDIGRNGEFILHEGRHRLIIAQILDVDHIPVRVKTRHKQWQKIREELCTNQVNRDVDLSHPDLIQCP